MSVNLLDDSLNKYFYEQHFQGQNQLAPIKGFKKASRKRPENAQKVLDAITVNPFISRQELVKKTGLTEYSIKHSIAKLKKEKTIKRIGSDKGGH